MILFSQLKCLAKIYNIYEETAEQTIEEDLSNVMDSGSSSQINSYQLYNHPQGGELSSDGLYITHQTSGKCNYFRLPTFFQRRIYDVFSAYGIVSYK